jgi:hypothetical protein
MTFTTPCFVRVENPEKRKELIEWLEGIGYRLEYLRNDGVIVLTSENRVYVYGEALYRVIKVDYDTIDCGENTELFKALAAMNEWNDRKQWYAYTEYPTNEGKNGVRKFVFNEPARFDSFVDVPSGYYRKATAEEIVEYFKNKER